MYSDGDYSAFRNENTKFIGENEDHLKLGREFYMYKQQLLQNPKDKASPAREDEGLRISLLKAPGVLNDENPGYQYRPVSKKQEPNFYKIENPRYSQFEVKAWIQDSRCDCKKKGVERWGYYTICGKVWFHLRPRSSIRICWLYFCYNYSIYVHTI